MAPKTSVRADDNLILLSKLLKAKTASDISRAIDQYPQRSGWYPFNRDEQNLTGIRSLDDPMRALIEDVTNAQDAVIERIIAEMGVDPSTFRSPHEAVMALFPDDASKSNKIKVTVNPQPNARTATVKVLDYGCGIAPQDAWDTILSLAKGKKKAKKYTIGTWGVGGASANAFREDSGYGVIVSRASGSPVWFTVIRFNKGSDDMKQGYYECLTEPDGSVLTVPNLPLPTSLPKSIENPERVSDIQQGTLIMHFGYELGYYKSNHNMAPNSRACAFSTYMFRSPLPFDIDTGTFRDPKKAEQARHPVSGKANLDGKKVCKDLRHIKGTGNYLDDLWAHDDSGMGKEEERSVDFCSQAIPISMKVDGEDGGNVQMTYYLRSERSKRNFNLMLTHPNMTVLVTYNGQALDYMSIDELNPRLRSEFSYLCSGKEPDLIVELALDGLKREARNSILTATRAAVQKKSAWNKVLKDTGDYILRCQYLDGFNAARREGSLTSGTRQSKSDEEGVAYAMRYVEGLMGTDKLSVGGSIRVRKHPRPPKAIILNKDKPTEIRFLSKETDFNLDGKNHRYTLWIETNAPNGYGNPDFWVEDPDGRVVGSPRVGILQDLNGGRVRLYIDLRNEVKGDMGTVVARYEGVPEARIDFTVTDEKPDRRIPRKKERGKGTQKGTLSINLQPINPSHQQWERFQFSKEQEREFSFDIKSGAGLGVADVFYNDEKFTPLNNSLKDKSEGERSQFMTAFKRLLAAQAAVLYGGRRADQPLTPEILAERKASAVAMLMASEREVQQSLGKKK